METGTYVFRYRNGIPHDAYDSRTQMTRTDIGMLSSVQY